MQRRNDHVRQQAHRAGEAVSTPTNFRVDVEALAHDVVKTLAPDELATLGLVALATLDDRGRPVKARRDDPLGMGIELTSLGAVALEVASAVLTFISTQVAEATRTAIGEQILAWIRNIFRARPRSEAPRGRSVKTADLSTEQLRAVHHVAVKKCAELGVAHEKSIRLADAVTSSLARGNTR